MEVPHGTRSPGLRELIETALELRLKEGLMTDPIGDALAIALDEIEEHAGDERYNAPEVAARISTVRAAMQDLQLYLDGLLS